MSEYELQFSFVFTGLWEVLQFVYWIRNYLKNLKHAFNLVKTSIYVFTHSTIEKIIKKHYQI